MKKFLFPLFAVLLLTGCGGGDDKLSVADMAGTYTFTEAMTVEGSTTVTFTSPDVSGTLTLTSTGGYTLNATLLGESLSDSGSFTVADPTITFYSTDGSQETGAITDDRLITITGIEEGMTITLKFTKS